MDVTAPDATLAAQSCDAARRALARMAACGVTLSDRQSITITDTIDGSPDCLGVYHCGTHQIEVLSPTALDTLRRDDSAFRSLSTPVYFASIIAHELAHAAHAAVPCPFPDCLVTSEYVAYAMQVYSLPPAQRTAFEADMDMEVKISRYNMSEMGLRMAPDRFARNVWAHFSQRDNGCAYVRDMMTGDFFLDTERP